MNARLESFQTLLLAPLTNMAPLNGLSLRRFPITKGTGETSEEHVSPIKYVNLRILRFGLLL